MDSALGDELLVVGRGYAALPLAMQAIVLGYRVVGLDAKDVRVIASAATLGQKMPRRARSSMQSPSGWLVPGHELHFQPLILLPRALRAVETSKIRGWFGLLRSNEN